MSALPSTRSLRILQAPPVPNGTVVGIGFVLLANLACLAGAAALVTPLFVGGAAATAYALSRRSPLMSAEFALWLWLLAPQVRRVVDQATGYHEPSPVLLAAPLASLVMLPCIRELRWSGMQRAIRPLLVTAVALAFGYAVGAARIGLRPATAALLVWLVPVLFGLQLVAIGRDVVALRSMMDRVFMWGAIVVGVYGVAQFFLMPSWDAFWMRWAPMSSIGSPNPFEVRVFSTLNSPAPLGTFLAAAALYLTSVAHRLRLPAQVAALTALGLSLVRSAWLAFVLGLLVILAAGRPRAKAAALAALAVVLIGVLQVSGPMLSTITDRIDESRAGRQDDSFQGRISRYHTVLPMLADEALGRGLGASGGVSGLTIGGPEGIDDLDSGVLAYPYALGVPVAAMALGAVAVSSLAIARTGLRSAVLPAGVIAASVSILAQMVSGNTLTGVAGIFFFALWGLSLRQLVAVHSAGRPTAGSRT